MTTIRDWDDTRLDATLDALGEAWASDVSLDAVRVRVLPPAADLKRGRRGLRVVAASVGVAVVTLGGVAAAAAGGVLGDQARVAFGRVVDFDAFAGTPVMRVGVRTPDGGLMQLWTRSGRDTCAALLFTDPGATEPGKPYFPSAACHTGSSLEVWEVGSAWTASDGRVFLARGGRVSESATKVALLSADGRRVDAVVDHGYYVAFTPMDVGDDHFNGLDWADASGRIVHERLPRPVP